MRAFAADARADRVQPADRRARDARVDRRQSVRAGAIARWNRFGGNANDRQVLTVLDASKLASGRDAIVETISAGAFPRELRVTADGRTLLVTNFQRPVPGPPCRVTCVPYLSIAFAIVMSC